MQSSRLKIQRSWIRRSSLLFLAIAACTMLTKCTSSTKKKSGGSEKPGESGSIQRPAALKLPGVETVTGLGRNSDGVFSGDGLRIAYVSEGRSPNGTSQIFEMNMKTHRERQVTFQDGLAASPRYVTGTNDLLYCNNSDEMKEKLELHHIMETLGGGHAGAPSQSPTRMEIYLRESNGSRILRLTTNPGYDCEIGVHPKHKKFIYVSEQNSKYRLAQIDLVKIDLAQTRHESLRPSAHSIVHHPIFSPDGKNLVWAEGDVDSSLQLVYGLADGHMLKALTTVDAVHWQATPSPNGRWIVFSSNRGDASGKAPQTVPVQVPVPVPVIVPPVDVSATVAQAVQPNVAVGDKTTSAAEVNPSASSAAANLQVPTAPPSAGAAPPSALAHPTGTPPNPGSALSVSPAATLPKTADASIGKNFSLYAYNLEKSCMARLTRFDSGDDFHPYFSPDGQRILFTHRQRDQSQLFLLSFSDTIACDTSLVP